MAVAIRSGYDKIEANTSPTILGVFCQPYPNPILHNKMALNDKVFSTRFHETSPEGKNLKDGTREFQILPQPHQANAGVAVALIISKQQGQRGGGDFLPSLDNFDFKVARAGSAHLREMRHTLEIEIYSSSRKSWLVNSIVLDVTVQLDASWRSAFAIGDVTFWTVVFYTPQPKNSHCFAGSKMLTILLAHDCTESSSGVAAKLIKPPPDDVIDFSRIAYSQCFGFCDGQVVCSRCDHDFMQIWLLKDFRTSNQHEWMMIHNIHFVDISISPPEFRAHIGLDDYGNADPKMIAFQPQDLQWILIYFLRSGILVPHWKF
ncbi:hypothetical protein ACH5RR_024703 [Cinchona calisaya]|uniref:F-box protein n=1 Tax=Cinchona calisaya TaxID=153742 RepID=A0ABD2YXH1_9GENT